MPYRRITQGKLDVKLQTYKVIQLWDCTSFYFGLYSALKDTVEKCVNVGLFSEVVKSLGFFGCLHFLNVGNDLSEQRQRCEKPNFELIRVSYWLPIISSILLATSYLLTVRYAVFLWTDEIKKNLVHVLA